MRRARSGNSKGSSRISREWSMLVPSANPDIRIAEAGTLMQPAGDLDLAFRALHNSIHCCQAKSGAFAWLLGGEKRFENVRLRLRCHPVTGVGNFKYGIVGHRCFTSWFCNGKRLVASC